MASRYRDDAATTTEQLELVPTGTSVATAPPPTAHHRCASSASMGGGFGLLMWKNLLLQRRRMVALLIQLGLPVLFFLIMVSCSSTPTTILCLVP